MKKLTFLFVAAVMAVSANAQAPFGSCSIGQYGLYDLETGIWIDAVPAHNQMVTLAIQVTDQTALAWLAQSPYNTLALQDFRLAPGGAAIDASKKSFRLQRVSANLYAINIVLKQVWSDFDLTSAPIVEEGIINCHSGLGQAWSGGEGSACISGPGWGYEAYGYCHIGFGPAEGADYATQLNCGDANDVPPVPGVCLPVNGPTGIEEVFANPQEVVRVEYFNLQGIKLQAEPAEGLFIAVPYYKNGVRGEAQKVLNRK